MATDRSNSGSKHLRTLLNLGAAGGLTDGQLLERFLARRDEAAELAFAVLVERHGPMVQRICRGILRDPHDAQDAFQATFLTLVRRAGSIRRQDSLGSWLHGVACRVALAARAASVRRRRHERRKGADVAGLPGETGDADLAPLLHDEIERLPARYRTPIVACYLEGLTHEQAAARLGWPLGTVRSRLARGRERLRLRLIRRGVVPPAALLGAALVPEPALASVPTTLVSSTVRAAQQSLASRSLWEGVFWMGKAKLAAGVLLPVVLVLGVAIAGNGPRPPDGDARDDPQPAPRVVAPRGPIIIEVPGRTAYDPDTLVKVRPRFDTLVRKVHVALGQRVKKGDPLVELYSTDLAQAKSDFQTKFVQWQHDYKLYELREKLVKQGAISNQLWVDTQNDEQKSRLDYNLALDKLQVYEVSKEEIEVLVEQLRDKGRELDPARFGEVAKKASLTLRSKADGYVIEREVVPDNFYAVSSVLMVIAPRDHLWVLASPPAEYLSKVREGQTVDVECPFLDQRIQGTVQLVRPEFTEKGLIVRLRGTIPNPDGRLKGDMMVKLRIAVP